MGRVVNMDVKISVGRLRSGDAGEGEGLPVNRDGRSEEMWDL